MWQINIKSNNPINYHILRNEIMLIQITVEEKDLIIVNNRDSGTIKEGLSKE